MAPPSPRSHSFQMFLTAFLFCTTLFAPSFATLFVPNQFAASPSSITIPKLFDVDAAVAEVVANHVNPPESAPSPASDSQGLEFPIISVSRDDMPHPMADSRLLTGLLDIVHADMSNVEKELSSTNVRDTFPIKSFRISLILSCMASLAFLPYASNSDRVRTSCFLISLHPLHS